MLAAASPLVGTSAAARAQTPAFQGSPRRPGAAMSTYGAPSTAEANVVRQRIRSAPGTTGSGASSTPLQHLRGTITPSGLHFERHHSGVPNLQPSTHTLTLSGAVRQSIQFTLEQLHRYPMVTRRYFLECSGNSAVLLAKTPQAWECGDIHGLVSASEWTGVPLSTLLRHTGIKVAPETGWVIAEGADAGRMNRSIPLSKCLDDAMIALYQNGERLRPENGYPMRLFLPGYEGNMSIKWLHRLEVSDAPLMSREETSKYTDLQANGRATGFSFEMGVKSIITSPSPGLSLSERGVYQISGLAWSGAGAVARVEVSADDGQSWVDADFEQPPAPLHLARFNAAWNWQGQTAYLLSRATDDQGNVQPTRKQWIAANGTTGFYHYNASQVWRVQKNGEVENSYGA